MTRIRVGLLTVGLVLCAAVTPALAQDETPADNGNDLVALFILLLGAVGAGLAYVFYDRWRQSYETLAAQALAKSGVLPETEFDPVASSQFLGQEAAGPPAPVQPKVKGPIAVVVGEPAVYKALLEEQPAADTAWTVAPAESATVEPATGPESTLTASKEGPITVTATRGEGEGTPVHVTALPRTRGGKVPILGTSWAGVTAVIIAIAIAGALTALGTLGGDAFIAFLGPVVGYFFAAARDTSQSGGSAGDTREGGQTPAA